MERQTSVEPQIDRNEESPRLSSLTGNNCAYQPQTANYTESASIDTCICSNNLYPVDGSPLGLHDVRSEYLQNLTERFSSSDENSLQENALPDNIPPCIENMSSEQDGVQSNLFARGSPTALSSMPNLRGRSLSENAINSLYTQHVDNADMDSRTVRIACDHSNTENPSHRINDVFINILPNLDSQPPSYEFCKTNKITNENSGPTVTVSTLNTNATPHATISNGMPPTYREATANGRYLEDAPPTYHSLFTESMLRAMQPFTSGDGGGNESDRGQNFLQGKKLLTFLLSAVIITVGIGFILIMPLCMITVGVANIHSCPAQPRIPIYLIVLGIFQMLECFGRLGYYVYRATGSSDPRERFKNKDPLIYFMVVWFVVGSMWVYQTPYPCFTCTGVTASKAFNVSSVNDSAISSDNLLEKLINSSISTTTGPKYTVSLNRPRDRKDLYCDVTVYRLAFGLVTLYYSIVGLLCLLVILDATVRVIGKCCCNQ